MSVTAHRPPVARRGPLAAAVHLLLPAPCFGCGVARAGGEDFALCLRCRGRLALHRPGCPRCGQPLPDRRRRAEPCADCRRRPPAYRHLLTPWSFEEPLVAVVHALKFGRCAHLGEALARPLAEWLRDHRALRLGERRRFERRHFDHRRFDHRPDVDLVVPVPLHTWRLLCRGYNQAESIARPLAALLGLPFARPLTRHRATRPQSLLPRRERQRNVASAFRTRRRARLAGRRVLLVDDVATTGATLAAAARTLRQAGATQVIALATARTPPPQMPD